MKFVELDLPGLFAIEPEEIADARGSFVRLSCAAAFATRGLESRFVQTSLSRNHRAGTLRGLHFQQPPHAEVKLVRCIRGSLWDVVVDLRPDSPARGRWTALELSGCNRRALYIPQGFAHGFQTLEDDTEVLYEISAEYRPEAASGLRWDDPALAIDWPPAARRILSDRDRGWPLIGEASAPGSGERNLNLHALTSSLS
jgi:dTDP-4-dehydrorhamnose 3,5-epimerase